MGCAAEHPSTILLIDGATDPVDSRCRRTPEREAATVMAASLFQVITITITVPIIIAASVSGWRGHGAWATVMPGPSSPMTVTITITMTIIVAAGVWSGRGRKDRRLVSRWGSARGAPMRPLGPGEETRRPVAVPPKRREADGGKAPSETARRSGGLGFGDLGDDLAARLAGRAVMTAISALTGRRATRDW